MRAPTLWQDRKDKKETPNLTLEQSILYGPRKKGRATDWKRAAEQEGNC